MNALGLLLGYLCGCFPTGPWLAKRRGVDLRRVGSGNIGASNAARALGFGFGARVLLGDALKGFLPVALAGLWWPDSSAQEAAALGAVLGHLWPVTLRFRGGKGVATAFGAFLALSPEAALWALLVWVLLVAITRKSAVGSLVAALALPLLLWWRGVPSSVWGIALLIAGLIYYKHRENIARLGQGNENSL